MCFFLFKKKKHKIWEYGKGKQILDYRHGNSGWAVGFEIEKSKLPKFSVNSEIIYKKKGFVIEKDSSVPDGFELKTPIYPLFENDIEFIFRDLKKMKKFINIPHVKNAGCHINISCKEKKYHQILNELKGWLPFIFSLYSERIENKYCSLRNYSKMLKNCEMKYQAIRKKEYNDEEILELRIPGPVIDIEDLFFRINLLREIFKSSNLGKSFIEVLKLITYENSNIFKMLDEYFQDRINFQKVILNAFIVNIKYQIDEKFLRDKESFNKIFKKFILFPINTNL